MNNTLSIAAEKQIFNQNFTWWTIFDPMFKDSTQNMRIYNSAQSKAQPGGVLKGLKHPP